MGSLEDDSGSESNDNDNISEVYIPGKSKQVYELEADPSAYIFLHRLQAGAPCLSFDVIPDDLGSDRENFPLTCYIVSGTQAAKGKPNYINIMKLDNITKTQRNLEQDDSDDDGDGGSAKVEMPSLQCVSINHSACVNRLRASHVNTKVFAATWSEVGSVFIFDISQKVAMLDGVNFGASCSDGDRCLVHTVTSHMSEGFGIDWSQFAKGWLGTGDCSGEIHLTAPCNSGWRNETQSLLGHTGSVEDIQWSLNESNVLASCSVDRSIRIWNTSQRAERANVLTLPEAHSNDVNVIHWNPVERHLLASGGDDGVIKIWDLRMFQSAPVSAVAVFTQHTQPITSLEWNPHDASVLAVSGSDDQISIWDLSVEREDDHRQDEVDIPPQLLFQHCGQTDMKELHWHPQLPGVIISTALSDFNIFRTICV